MRISTSNNVLRTLCVAGALCSPVFSQVATDPNTGVDTGARGGTRVSDGGNFGWIGLLGLAGLMGLRRGDHEVRRPDMRTTDAPRGI